MGGIDFNCTGLCGTAHTAADTGGEFIAAYASSLLWDDPNNWDVPAGDLVNIYALANRTVNASDINQCTLIFYAGSWAIRLLGALIEPLEINGAPTFTENFLDLPLGEWWSLRAAAIVPSAGSREATARRVPTPPAGCDPLRPIIAAARPALPLSALRWCRRHRRHGCLDGPHVDSVGGLARERAAHDLP